MTKPEPILSHMPRHIKEKIVDSLTTTYKLSLRQCSKEFKSVVDQSKITYDNLTLEWKRRENAVIVKRMLITKEQIELNNNHRKYNYNDHLTQVEFHPLLSGFLKRNINENSEVLVENEDFIGAAVEQFVKIFRNPKVFIRTLSIYLDDGYGEDELYDQRRELIMDKLNESLGALNRRVAVGCLALSTDLNANNIRRILPHLQPGTLETLYITPQALNTAGSYALVNLNGIIGMEQWKQATRLSGYDFKFDRETTAHFADVISRVHTFGVEDVKYMIPFFLREDGWISRCVFCENLDDASINQYLSQLPGVEANHLSRTFTIRRDGIECCVSVVEFSQHVRIFNPKRIPSV